jgi:enoyl-[acyl-carrier protein] reductase / trans-2-enoyl-CoA reductase (NAD+)
MIIAPARRGYLYVTAHPDGCAMRVRDSIRHIRSQPRYAGPARALVIGSSTGLGLASRTALTFGAGTATLGVCLERPGKQGRTATPGWYNTAAFEEVAAADGLFARSVIGDAFSDATKEQTVAAIHRNLGQVDLVVYSIAAPRRTDPRTGEIQTSSLKTLDMPYTDKAFDAIAGEVIQRTIAPATPEEISGTIAVMGGGDWRQWIEVLLAENVLAPGASTLAYSYVGGPQLAPTYRRGTIGLAKEHLEATAVELTTRLRDRGGRGYVAVMKALVTQASTAIPMSTLYTLLLNRVLDEWGLNEGPTEQAYRLFAGNDLTVDASGRVRLDDRELRSDVQEEIRRRWDLVTTENLTDFGDPHQLDTEVARLYGFGVEGCDYSRDANPIREIVGFVADTPVTETTVPSPSTPREEAAWSRT